MLTFFKLHICSFQITLVLASLLIVSCGPKLPEEIQVIVENLPDDLDYNIHVKPILSDKCFYCHGPDENKQQAGLRLDQSEIAFAPLKSSSKKVAIDPGDLGDSEVFYRIISEDPNIMMPRPESHLTLSNYEKAVLIKWIKDGAEYKPHWAFEKPVLSGPPKVENEDWVKNSIDRFVLSKLEAKNWRPSERATKETLLRRVYFDLTGLPPGIQKIEDFQQDSSEGAFEKVVDELLASPHYGERMSNDWLDVARFADTHGYTVDRVRDMSPYRDWVIKSFNTNQPYDQFIHWQLAGDLMPEPSKDMLIATAFNRNHQQNMEGGIIEKEFQTEYVIDRTNTLGDAFLGLSLSCAKCHDHKYDPISQKNYYELFSFFNNVKEAGQISWNNAMPTPTLLLPTVEQEELISFINKELNQQEISIVETIDKGQVDFDNWLRTKRSNDLNKTGIPNRGLEARYSFDKERLNNELNSKNKGFMSFVGSSKENPVFEKHGDGIALALNGDAWLDTGGAGVFRKSNPFTIGLKLLIPEDFEQGVLFHKSNSERLYNYRGYHLLIKEDGTIEANLAHTAPSNALTKISINKVIKGRWIHLAMTYDGSSQPEGLRVFMDGEEIRMRTETDQLSKDILFGKPFEKEPGIQIGGWARGYGFKNGKVDDIVVYDRTLIPFEVKILAEKDNWAQMKTKDTNELNADEIKILRDFYFTAVHQPTLQQMAVLKTKRDLLADSIENIPELMIMKEMLNPKPAYVLKRGQYDAPAEKVFPNTPSSILPYSDELPPNRYGLAQWLTDPEHPLTARVAVNRFWQNIFGLGLVKTAEDFGNQGTLPSHPELLDYLAVSFVQSGWDVKRLLKEIVLSATYQQNSNASKEMMEEDAENIFLSRGPSNRLSAEMIRDNALAAASLLSPQIGGKSIKPYQPAGLWEINNSRYTPDSSDDIYRRSLYILIKRTVPNPTLATFDGPSRSYCVIRRQKTNTPLQALVTLNDPTFVEASKVLGMQMSQNKNDRLAIKEAYQKLTGKTPIKKEVDLLLDLKNKEQEKFDQYPAKTSGWLKTGYYELDKGINRAEVSAYAVVANVIMNSDASLMKR